MREAKEVKENRRNHFTSGEAKARVIETFCEAAARVVALGECERQHCGEMEIEIFRPILEINFFAFWPSHRDVEKRIFRKFAIREEKQSQIGSMVNN